MNGLDEVLRLKRVHKRWAILNILFGALPVFGLINRFSPMLTDGYGVDLVPTLLPESLAARYNLILLAGLLALLASEILRRRFHTRHKEDLSL
ncbi:MAG: hypothetical protein ABIW76_05510 [Fibrobacteria bacterium]